MDVFSSDEYYKLIDKTIEYSNLHKLLARSKELYKKEKKSENNHLHVLKFKFDLPKKLKGLQEKSIKKIYKTLKKKVEKKQKKISSFYKSSGFK
jgi:hypothetical protein